MAYGFPPIVAVDFDGTIKTDERFEVNDCPIANHCVEVLTRLHNKGCRLILWTCRGPEEGGGLKEALDFLKKHEILQLFEKANQNVDGLPFDCRPKIYADYYLDDKNLGGFPGFLKAEEIIMNDEYFQ
jgi:histidinol phosphatase-like enzyme